MFWADELVNHIISTDRRDAFWVDDMKTPSGRVHVGALRGVVLHGLIHQLLIEKGEQSTFSYVYNDMDPMDAFPGYLPESFKQHMGKPLFQIPSHETGAESMAHLYADEFTKVFNSLGFNPKILRSSEMYRQGKFDAIIRQALDQRDKIYDLYHTISGYNKPGNWYPYQVICPRCGKVGTTITTGWDGKQVSFVCQKDLVKWAEGCGYQGKIEPTGTNGKLMWKVDWAAHWQVIGITVEGAGKDHMTEHGSHDLSGAIAQQVFDYKTPYGYLYEWFLAKGGSKMSSSKGVGVSAFEISQTLPPEILRYLLVRTTYKRAIIFDPSANETILQLFDDYDQAERHYYQKTNPIESRAWELSQVGSVPNKEHFLPRFRDIVNLIQNPSVNLMDAMTQVKGSQLTELEQSAILRRVDYAKIWLEKYAPPEMNFKVVTSVPESVKSLSKQQKQYLLEVGKMLTQTWATPDELQQALYEKSKAMNLPAKQAFGAIYTALLDKTHGPKAAWLILENLDVALTRFTQINDVPTSKNSTRVSSTKSERISFSSDFANKYPSASVGFALIRNVSIKPKDDNLNNERQQLLSDLSNLTTEKINEFPEIQSYRKMYKDMKVDWHSRRPSPEALLRRIATGKGLYPNINTCVDAYNLAVMRMKISSGAFDASQLKFPIVVDIAKGGEKEFFIGDKDEPTTIKEGEVCYFDQVGPYNMDYNYRDALRTSVTTSTTDLWINIDGIYDISPEEVLKALDANIAIIQKYCGGEVVEKGIILAGDN